MKKGVILLIFLIFIKLVSAQQEINIFGASYPIILVVPIFFMGLITLLFLGLILKDNLPKIIHFKFKAPKIRFKKAKHIEHIKPEEVNFHSKLDSLKIKLHRLGEEVGFNEFNNIAKEFIKVRFNIKQEFTFPEVANLIKDHAEVVELANKITHLKYGDIKVSYHHINELLEDFKHILSHYRIKHEIIKLSLLDRLKLNIAKLFAKKKVEIKPIKVKHKLIEITEKPVAKPIIEKEKIPLSYKLRRLNYKLFAGIRKFYILNLIKRGRTILIKNPRLAKNLYARALLSYYKLPIKFEKNIVNELNNFHDEILLHRTHEKAFLDVSKSLLKLKHRGEHISKKGVGLVNIMKDFIKKEELLAATKLREFSKKLHHEAKQLKYYAPKKIEIKPEIKPVPEVMHIETKQPDIKFEEFHKERLGLIKKPLIQKEEKHYVIKPIKRLSKNLRLLQKQKSQIYSKLVDLNVVHPAHKLEHKLKAQ